MWVQRKCMHKSSSLSWKEQGNLNISSQNAGSDCININRIEWDLLTTRACSESRNGNNTWVVWCVCAGYKSTCHNSPIHPQKHHHTAYPERSSLTPDSSSSIRSDEEFRFWSQTLGHVDHVAQGFNSQMSTFSVSEPKLHRCQHALHFPEVTLNERAL